MTGMTLELESSRSSAIDWNALRSNGLAAAIALALHGVVLGGLMLGWTSQEKPPEPVRTMTTQLFILPPEPAPVMAAPVAVMEPVEAPEPEVKPAPVAKPVEPQVDTQRQARQLEQAALARKRVEEQKREREAEQRQHVRDLEQQRQQEQQRVAQQQAEQQRQAEQARQTAERNRLTQQQAAAADSSQYQPLSKEAPDYPQRALDKGIEGDCTVVYDVSPQGRVVNPQVLGACHPMFIRPSMAAAETFRYQPRVVEGRAVMVSGVKNTFHYRIK
ncbi:TonB family protein [Pseudomonas sp. NPDC089734]|uniref:energy transducer TonB n=1 Tax=Pseudomonas sp. NPDC089734 TaxID=3364469 RepID=UPI0037F7C84A